MMNVDSFFVVAEQNHLGGQNRVVVADGSMRRGVLEGADRALEP